MGTLLHAPTSHAFSLSPSCPTTTSSSEANTPSSTTAWETGDLVISLSRAFPTGFAARVPLVHRCHSHTNVRPFLLISRGGLFPTGLVPSPLDVGIGIWGFYLPKRDLPQLNVEVDGTFIRPLLPASTSDNQSVWHQWEVAYVTPLDLKNHTTTLQVVEASHANPFCFWKVEALVPDRLSQLVSEPSSTAEITSSPTSSAIPSGSGNHTPVGTLVGAVIAAVSLTLLLCGALFLWWRRSRQHRYRRTSLDDDGACSDCSDDHHLSTKLRQAESGRSTPSIRKSTRSFSFKPFSLPRVFPRRKQTGTYTRDTSHSHSTSTP